MSNSLFRAKSIERISSPEQLNDYIRVSSPSVWMLLAAIIILLVGVCTWGIFGRMDTVLPAVAVVQDGSATVYLREGDMPSVQEGMAVSVSGNEGTVASIAAQPVQADESFSDYMLHLGSLQQGEWVWPVVLDVQCPDGVYSAEIITESASPMSFVMN